MPTEDHDTASVPRSATRTTHHVQVTPRDFAEHEPPMPDWLQQQINHQDALEDLRRDIAQQVDPAALDSPFRLGDAMVAPREP